MEAVVLDTPEQIKLARMLTLKHALRLEMTTGLKHSSGRSAYIRAKEMYKLKGCRARVWAQLDIMCSEAMKKLQQQGEDNENVLESDRA